MFRLKYAWMVAICGSAFTISQAHAQSNTFPASGNVGIGTTSPSVPLEVWVNGVGTTKIEGPNLRLNNFSSQYDLLVNAGNFNIQNDSDAGAPIRFTLQGGTGNIGIGTTSPLGALHVDAQGSVSGGGTPTSVFGNATANFGSANDTVVNGAFMFPGSGWTNGWLLYYPHMTSGKSMFRFTSQSANVGDFAANVAIDGSLGVGTTSPGAKLDVNGNVKISGAGGNLAFPDNTVQSTAWTGVLSGGDYAESVDVTGDREAFEPGDLLVIDPKEHGHFKKGSTAYSTLVGGVYATKPGVTGRRQPRVKSSEEEVPMAMVGIVPTKVSAENGPIHDGDLLVSSSIPGYAMKGTNHRKLTGAVLGKALGNLESGQGVIEVLISLQ